MRLLVEAGTDVDLRNRHGDTPLMHAVKQWASPETIACLLQYGADPNRRYRWSRSTSLGRALESGRDDVAELLRRAGARR